MTTISKLLKCKPKRYESRPLGYRFWGYMLYGVWDNKTDWWSGGYALLRRDSRKNAKKRNKAIDNNY